jgi:hypothetical protein
MMIFHVAREVDSLALDWIRARASPSLMALKFDGVFSVDDERKATPKPRIEEALTICLLLPFAGPGMITDLT